MGASGGINIPINVYNTGQSPAQLVADVNRAIGAFRQMGQILDTTNAQAVAGYRQQGEALYVNLLTLGRTKAELAAVAAAITRAEQAYGSNTVNVTASTIAVGQNAQGMRRGASAIATLAFAAEGGAGSAKAMAIAMGSATQSIAALGTGAGYAALGGLGALVVIAAVIVESLYKMSAEGKRAKDTLGDLGNLNATQLGILAAREQANFDAEAVAVGAFYEVVKKAVLSGNAVEAAAATATYEIEKKHFESRLEEHDKFRKAYLDAEVKFGREIAAETIKQQEEARASTITRTLGPAAGARAAADNELADQRRALQLKGVLPGSAEFNAIDEANRIIHANKIAEINRAENEQIQSSQLAFANDRLTAEAKLQDDLVQVAIDAADRKRTADLKRIADDKNLNAHPDEQKRQVADVEATHTATLLNIEKERGEKLLEVRREIQDKIDELSDSGVDEAKIRARYKKELDIAHATIASDSALVTPADRANAQSVIDLAPVAIKREIAKAELDQALKNDNLLFDTQQQHITQIEDLRKAGDISDEEARKRTLAALIAQRDAAIATLTQLQALAAQLPGNAQAQQDVETYTTKVLELGIAISQTADRFHDLKTAGIEATQSAIATLIQSVPKVFLQSGAVYAIDQMKVHLASASAQLADLMKGPQTPAVTAQITALRAEIQNTNIELKNAKSELTTWKTLFLDAARSIVSALAEVSSKMLATLLIQDLLHGFGGGGGGDGNAILTLSGDVAGAFVGAASGGYITGPGTGTSDSIPARLSHGEYVLNARATARVGQSFLDSINALGSMPTASRPSRIAHYAGGGLVSASSNDAATSLHATFGLEQGLVLRHLESSEGEGVLLKVLSKNQNKLRAMLGR